MYVTLQLARPQAMRNASVCICPNNLPKQCSNTCESKYNAEHVIDVPTHVNGVCVFNGQRRGVKERPLHSELMWLFCSLEIWMQLKRLTDVNNAVRFHAQNQQVRGVQRLLLAMHVKLRVSDADVVGPLIEFVRRAATQVISGLLWCQRVVLVL